MDNQIVVMAEDEARKLVDEIRSGIVNVGRKLLELKERDGWKALGYSTWRDCAMAEFNFKQAYVYKLLAAAEVERNIAGDDFYTIVENTAIPESQLRPLAALEPAQQREAYQMAVDTAPNGKVTAAHVQSVVDELYGDDEEDLENGCHNCAFSQSVRGGSGSLFCSATGYVIEDVTCTPCGMKLWEHEKDDEVIEDEIKHMPHVSHNSGAFEWYTPSEYIEAARVVMGKIDLDPASSVIANQIVMADKFYTSDDDGLSEDWRGKVWMNPPYSADLIWQFAAKLRKHYQAGDITEAIVLVNNATETAWFYDMAQAASAIAFTHSRVKYLNESLEPKGAPLQGQAVIYFGKNVKKFRHAFDDLCWSAVL